MFPKYDFNAAILQQFKNSPSMLSLLESLAKKMGIGVEEIIQKCIDVDTAEGVWLDIIGIWVGAKRQISLTIIQTHDFGFDGEGFRNFDTFGGTFDTKKKTTGFLLTDPAFRIYIKMKAYANVSSCSITSINFMLSNLFAGRGNAWVKQTDTLEVTYNFDFELIPAERNLIMNRYLPVPAGFTIRIAQPY
jgi:hypothetical protein